MNIIYVIIFVIVLYYFSYKLCDVFPGNTPNGKRQTFCKYPFLYLFLYILIFLYIYFFTKRK